MTHVQRFSTISLSTIDPVGGLLVLGKYEPDIRNMYAAYVMDLSPQLQNVNYGEKFERFMRNIVGMVIVCDGEKPIGFATLGRVGQNSRELEEECFIREAYRGQHLTTEFISPVIRTLARDLGAEAIFAEARTDNETPRIAALKIGFQPGGIDGNTLRLRL